MDAAFLPETLCAAERGELAVEKVRARAAVVAAVLGEKDEIERQTAGGEQRVAAKERARENAVAVRFQRRGDDREIAGDPLRPERLRFLQRRLRLRAGKRAVQQRPDELHRGLQAAVVQTQLRGEIGRKRGGR